MTKNPITVIFFFFFFKILTIHFNKIENVKTKLKIFYIIFFLLYQQHTYMNYRDMSLFWKKIVTY